MEKYMTLNDINFFYYFKGNKNIIKKPTIQTT